jgi:hypothetical protein
MGARRFVFLGLVCRSLPLTADDWIFALGRAFFTLVAFVIVQRRTWKLLIAKLLIKSKRKHLIWRPKLEKSSRNQWTVSILVEINFPHRWRFRIEGWIWSITWHSLGNSLTAFSTARLRDALFFEISTRQFGQVATWSRSRPSARRCVKQPALWGKTELVWLWRSRNRYKLPHQMPGNTL